MALSFPLILCQQLERLFSRVQHVSILLWIQARVSCLSCSKGQQHQILGESWVLHHRASFPPLPVYLLGTCEMRGSFPQGIYECFFQYWCDTCRCDVEQHGFVNAAQRVAQLPVNNRSTWEVQGEVKLAPKKGHVFTGMCETPVPLERAVLIANNSTLTVSHATALDTCQWIVRHAYTTVMNTK